MTHVDPFAPADDPRHPSQQPVPDKVDGMREVLEQEAADIAAYDELAGTHLTPRERELRERVLGGEDPGDDAPALPTLGDLQARVDALVDYLERREGADYLERPDGQDSQPPRILDAFGVEHVLEASEDGTSAHWRPVERTYHDMTVVELQALLRERQLPVSGNKPELIARLDESDKQNAAANEQADEGDETNDELARKLAALDEAKGGSR